MDRLVRFSQVPVGELFMYKGKKYNRWTHGRGKEMVSGKIGFINMDKHAEVLWLNAQETIMEK